MAIAPERTGIGIRRYFTTPGTDPYETVTWERRDARITNWATGAVAFEQLGVEVPEHLERQRHQHPGAEVLPGHARAPQSGSGLSSRSPTGWSAPSWHGG